jgi:hypothetical protein
MFGKVEEEKESDPSSATLQGSLLKSFDTQKVFYPSQINAIQTATTRTGFSLVQGPPGTGGCMIRRSMVTIPLKALISL